jgi:hypothetical protein
MTNTEIIELLNSNEGVNKAFEGLEYYDALRLVSKIISIIKDEKFDFNDTTIKHLRSFITCGAIEKSVRYWMVRNLVYISKQPSTRLSRPYGKQRNCEDAVFATIQKECIDIVKYCVSPSCTPKDTTFDEFMRVYSQRLTPIEGEEKDVDLLIENTEKRIKNPKSYVVENYRRATNKENENE